MGKLFFVLLAILVLRIPSFLEPYWYGDEGIYLTIGQSLRQGAILYRDIWDNKPPLLYLIYALSPTLLWARLTATACALATTGAIYFFLYRFISAKFAWAGALLAGILLSLPYPLLEGYIANAEIYFVLPITLSAFLIWQQTNQLLLKRAFPNLFLVGIFLTVSSLLKIPAVFDFVGMLLASYLLYLSSRRSFFKRKLYQTLEFLRQMLLPIALPATVTWVLVAGYFYTHNALSDFFIASLSQNVAYISVASGSLFKPSNPLFVKALFSLLGSGVLLILFIKRVIPPLFFFLSYWFIFSLYGALLSHRTYPHYLLQIVPSTVILGFYLLTNFRKLAVFNLLLIVIIGILGQSFLKDFRLQNFNYYQNFWDYLSERKEWTEYVNNFDPHTANNYSLAAYLAANTTPNNTIFVWGDNALIYTLSQRRPATKFIQAHHLTTINYQNYDWLLAQLSTSRPKFVIVDNPPKFAFPKLQLFLQSHYLLEKEFNNWLVYRLPEES